MSPISNASRLAEFGTGIGTAGAIIQVDNLNQRVGIGTTNPQATLQVGTGITMYADAGIISATTYSGNWGGAFNGTTATFSGAVNLDATTDSTSSSTGALIVDGGVGIAKNVYIGAGLSVAGTLTYEDVTSVDSVGLITAKSGVNITGGQLQVGVAYSVGAAGVVTAKGATFNGDVTINSDELFIADSIKHVGDTDTIISFPAANTIRFTTAGSQRLQIGDGGDLLLSGSAAGVSSVTWDASANSLIFNDNSKLKFGDAPDLDIWHDGSASYVQNATGELHLRSNTLKLADYNSSHVYFRGLSGDTSELYFDNSKKFETTNDGVLITGIATVSQGLNTDGLLSEKFHTTAGKLSDNTNIDLENGMVHYFSTQETTTSTPNIRYNSSKTLNNMLSTGDSITVTIITTAAAGGYSANMNIDGNGQTEEWVGGSAPSAGGSDGLDIYSYTILKTSSSPAYKVIANVLSATN